ncbi:PilZ domain-containing protein [Wenxinia saemankumensis]|uniref:PilZ domain-containing protein n=1 Tax=Wenxinia saemankumensis TaxID=1447782 RepID=UPI0009351442|nr:PilZ domain-containing protein [Wenxinia saemankumensis]
MTTTAPGQPDRDPRDPADFQIRIAVPTGWTTGRIRDASARGLRISADCPVAPGAAVKMVVGGLHVDGVIAWAEGADAGITLPSPLPPYAAGRIRAGT